MSCDQPANGSTIKLRFDRVVIFAPDLAAAQRFYTQVLGFELAGETGSRLHLLCGDVQVDIFRCKRQHSRGDHSYEPGSTVVFAFTDLDAAVLALRQQGVAILHDSPGVNGSGRYVAFCDPFGTVHELLQPHGTK